MRNHEEFVSKAPLGPRDFAAIAPVFGFANADAMADFAYQQQNKSENRELLMECMIPGEPLREIPA